jgi:two-component system, cell cycle sensor histidine kinase and response regulator CckA
VQLNDEESILFSHKMLLEDFRYSVKGFLNGIQAFDEFDKHLDQFDLIITDMTIPKMTRDELSLKTLKMKKDLPIILFTGYSERISE